MYKNRLKYTFDFYNLELFSFSPFTFNNFYFNSLCLIEFSNWPFMKMKILKCKKLI